jgi:predicted ABC-type transport system involved in lysophospholipase L1 biosynthesis ATPase subunit
VEAGARVGVIGPSGSGKSTLLYLMAGLDQPTCGVVRWPAFGPEAELRPDQIGMVFQTPSLLPTLTALGAKRSHLAAFMWSEAAIILAGGGLVGIGVGWDRGWLGDRLCVGQSAGGGI